MGDTDLIESIRFVKEQEFWLQLEPTDVEDKRFTDEEGMTIEDFTNDNVWRVQTCRHDYKVGEAERHTYWCHVYDERKKAEQVDAGAVLDNPDYLAELKRAETLDNARILHHSALTHLNRKNMVS